MPPGIWGGRPPPFVDIGGPSWQPGIWPPGSGIDMPAHPIVIPPEGVPPEITVPPGKVMLVVAIPGYGYKIVVIDKPGPPGNIPPSETPPPQPVPTKT